jgi:tetratricopeptide (TPR) repeat protein
MILELLQKLLTPRPKGWIAYYGLEDWYLSLSEDTRQKIKAYSPHPNEVDKGSHIGTTQSAQRYLLTIGTYASKDPEFAEFMFQYALKAPDDNPIDRHFVYNHMIDLLYKQREKRADAIDLCIKYCIEDIRRIDVFKAAWIKEYEGIQTNSIANGHMKPQDRYEVKLPNIPSFDRLRIIYEKQGKFREAIQVCSKAIEVEAWDIEAGNDQITKLMKKLTSSQNSR